MNKYLYLYLVGSVAALLVITIKVTTLWFLSWITKENVLRKNLRKLQPPPQSRFVQSVLRPFVEILIDCLLSWVGVLFNSWHFVSMLFKFIRERLVTVPEEVKQLRFPIWNNPSLPREAVWAYAMALSRKAGESASNAEDLLISLEAIQNSYPDFDYRKALDRLASLNALEQSTINETLNYLNERTAEDSAEKAWVANL